MTDTEIGKFKKVTQAQVLAAYRRNRGKGVRAFVRHNKQAFTHDERARRREQIATLRDQIKAIEEECKAQRGHWLTLLEKCEFFRDVHGDPPSDAEFLEAVANSRRLVDLADEAKELTKEKAQLVGSMHVYRWEAARLAGVGGVNFLSVDYQADTLEDLLAKIEGRPNG